MTHLKRALLVILAAGSLAACSGMTNTQQRVLSGGAIGAAGGAVISAIAGGPILLGTAIGAGAGAVAGAVTSH
jgi:osmotically inducible lipoprotein OsmB